MTHNREEWYRAFAEELVRIELQKIESRYRQLFNDWGPLAYLITGKAAV